MEDAQFSDEFCRFLQTAVPSVDAAELLLICSRSEISRTDRPCSYVSLRIDRRSFTVVRFACFRLGIAPLKLSLRENIA